ncbi:alcohol dehydrogenase catalytic domain-containing protein [Vibrio parahaemolyticus]|nr:alcohol dehydrogenase catalytic domain-containing protein [Vibrio parahaemolyticus]MDG2613258.1 alcohol dehydrogenase catalytic domain-containing protein [Vibrio parahaemolyticus]
MKAIVRNKLDVLEHISLPMPALNAEDEVLVRIVYTSLCRDDMRNEDKADVLIQPGIIGHEAVGIVEELGEYSKFKGLSRGDVVVVLPWAFCGKCHYCLSQRPNFCEESRFHQGVSCEYLVSNVSQLLKVPFGLTYKQAVMMEPVGCIIEALNSLDMNFNSRVAIIGGGFIGATFIKLLKLRGVKKITVVEPIAERREKAIAFGANSVVDPQATDFQYELSDCCDHQGYDCIIETSSNVDMLNMSLSHLTKGGILKIFTYYNNQSVMCVPLVGLYYSNITISWSCLCSIDSMNVAAEMIKRLALGELITSEFSFENFFLALESYKNMECYKVGVRYY